MKGYGESMKINRKHHRKVAILETTTNPLKIKGFTLHPLLTTPPHPVVRGGGQEWV